MKMDFFFFYPVKNFSELIWKLSLRSSHIWMWSGWKQYISCHHWRQWEYHLQ